MKKVVILNGNHLCHNPRVVKEAQTLAVHGFEVEVLGVWLEDTLAERDRELMAGLRFRYTPVARFQCQSLRSSAEWFLARVRRRAAQARFQWLSSASSDQLGYAVGSLLRAARSRKAGLYIAHSEPAMWVASRLSQEGFRVGIDMEDWFSEDLLPEARAHRPLDLIRRMESSLLCESLHMTCTSDAMGLALADAYGCARPLTVYNAFPWDEREKIDGRQQDRKEPGLPSIHWFSQSIGPGRGLEDLFASLELLNDLNFEVHLRGRLWPGYSGWLQERIPSCWKERIYFHDLVANDKLLSRIAEHDIGLALESDRPPSRDLTVTNKILQYLQAGLAVVATATRGQCEVAEQARGAVCLCSPGDAAGLAAQLRELLTNPVLLSQTKQAALDAARNVFCWEKMEPRLIESVEKSLA